MAQRSSLIGRGIFFLCAAGAAALLAACPIVYPEVKTPMREVPQGYPLSPAPPNNIRWIAVNNATIPPTTRDGRKWGNELTSGLPDPYAKLMLNNETIFQTTVHRATLKPTWPDAPKGNFRVAKDDRLRVEVWDARALNDKPIGIREVGTPNTGDVILERLDLETETGVRIELATERAHGRLGYGFNYEMRTLDVYITKVFEESPAARAGIRPGDQIVHVDGRKAREMTAEDLRVALHSKKDFGVKLSVKHPDGVVFTAQVEEGAVYPLYREIGKFE